ncbi:hypothetical protein Hanom_Chr03g00196151 [Helianthus anomalus]
MVVVVGGLHTTKKGGGVRRSEIYQKPAPACLLRSITRRGVVCRSYGRHRSSSGYRRCEGGEGKRLWFFESGYASI